MTQDDSILISEAYTTIIDTIYNLSMVEQVPVTVILDKLYNIIENRNNLGNTCLN